MTIDENAANSYLLQIYAFFLLVTYQNCKFSQGINLLLHLVGILPFLSYILSQDNNFCPRNAPKAVSEVFQKKDQNVEEWIGFVFFSLIFFFRDIGIFFRVIGIITNLFLPFLFSAFLSGYL